MHRWMVFFLALASPALATDPTRYTGKVGKLEAVYDIRWNSDDSVTGTYSYPARPGVIYRLEGHNREQGKLYLEEYTGDVLSARCFLSKRVTDGNILWEGEMRNTDGRVLPMTMARVRDARLVEKARIPNYFSRIPQQTIWPEPQHADTPVEMATVWYDDATYTEAEILSSTISDGRTKLDLHLGVYEDMGESFRFNLIGPKVSLEFPRAIPIPREFLQNRRVSLEISNIGRILSINLLDIAVTHYREHPSGKLEVRTLLIPDEVFEVEAHLFSETARRKAKVIEFVPDKLALPHRFAGGVGADLSMQTLRITAEFGTAIQVTEAGPGSLELESLSLDPEPRNVPWIPVGERNGWLDTPLSQRTLQAG